MIPAAYQSVHSLNARLHLLSFFSGGVQTAHDTFILKAGDAEGLEIISRGTAILLLGVYVAYLIFQA